MVFIHGGAFVLGSNQAPVQDGSRFARSGVVYVSLNYRLGVEGFLPIPGAPTNLGLRDQIAGLKWVQQNARAFGGDPGNVTVFGESAGAMSIADLLSSPLPKGLFRRAIVQSGHGAMVHSIPVARRLVDKLAKLLGVSPDVAGFGKVTPDQAADVILKVHQPTTRLDMREPDTRIDPAFGLSKFLPVWGDDVLPVKPIDGLKAGAGAEVDLLIGSNAEEMNLYFVPTGVRKKIFGWLAVFGLSKTMPRARSALKAYGLYSHGRTSGDAFTEAMHDLVFRWPARQFAAAHTGRTHVYEMDWRSPACGGELGACHGVELAFVFDTLSTVTGTAGLAGETPPQELADRVHRIWVEFARDGTLPWPEYSPADPQVFDLNAGQARAEPPMKAAAFLP
jgi:para-nitrobenzyl esterase